MNANVVLDTNVVLDLLLKRGPDYAEKEQFFSQLQQDGARLFFPVCALPALESMYEKEIERLLAAGIIKTDREPRLLARERLDVFLSEIQIISSLGTHWSEIPQEHPNRENALISLAAASLPGKTYIWTNAEDFISAGKGVVPGNHRGLREALDQKIAQSIPLIDLQYQQLSIRGALESRLHAVLRHGQYIMGPEIKELEERFADYVGIQHAITCSSGTDALLMALMAYNVGPGDAILTTPFTFIASAEVISLLGATPVFVDIDPTTFNMDPIQVQQAIHALENDNATLHPLPITHSPSPLTPKGVIPVDLFGLPADYDAIMAIAEKQGLFVLEDAAQSFGATYKGRRAGSLGHVAATSFFPAKPLGCYGDGGAVFTNDNTLAEKMASIRVHGKGTDKYDNVRIGLNARMDTLQAGILLAKLDVFSRELQSRQRVASGYTELICRQLSSGSSQALATPHVPEGLQSAWAQYSLLSDRRQEIQSALKAEGIPTAVYYPKPLHMQGAFSFLGYKQGDFPIAESVSRRIFSLPMHPYVADDAMERIVRVMTKAA